MESLTYQQVLADQFEENAKSMLVYPTEYEQEEDIPPEDNHPDELENKEEFQKFGGDHALATYQPKLQGYDDKTKAGVRYEKDVQTRVISIDSRFRPNQDLSSTDFHFKLTTPIKNVISVRLSGVEIPNTIYSFSKENGNISFRYSFSNLPNDWYYVQIPEGNYTPIVTGQADDLSLVIRTAMNTATEDDGITPNIPANPFTVSISLTTSKMTISNADSFNLDFGAGLFNYRKHDWGIGYDLGFRNKFYQNSTSYTGEAVVDTVDSNYLLIGLDPDWKVVTHNHPDRIQFSAFAKIIVNVPKFDVIYDNGSNTITKEYWFQQPTDITGFPVKLTDLYEYPVNLQGMNWSFTLEIKEALNPTVYEHIRSLV